MIGFVEILRSDTRNFLWTDYVQAELFGAIRKLWPMLNEESRKELCNMILKGPPRDLIPSLPENEWACFVDHKIWERLARIAQVDSKFSGPAAERLRGLERENPKWRLQGAERDNAAFGSEAYMGPSPEARRIADEWLRWPVPKIAKRIRSDIHQKEGNIYPGYFIDEVWDAITEKDRTKALKIIRWFLENGFYHEDIWGRALWAFSRISMQDDVSKEILNLIRNFPVNFLEKWEIICVVTHILNSMAKSLGENEIESNLQMFLDFWDRLFPYTIKESHSGIGEYSFNGIMGYAINHPAGNITEMLFHLFPGRNLPRGSKIHPDMKTRLEKILQSYDTDASGWRAGYVIIAFRLAWLHHLDSNWTEKMVVPTFDWSNEKKAKASWGGYLSNPRIDQALWKAIKGNFLLVFDHHDNLPNNSYRLFASVAIWWPDALSLEDARRCVPKMKDSGRYEVLKYLFSCLQNEETQPSVVWKERIKPWIIEVWPRDLKFRSLGEYFAFAKMAISTGDSFRDAVDTLYEFMGSIEDRATHIIWEINRNADSENSILNSDTKTLLKFLHKILPQTVEPLLREDIEIILNRMKDFDSAIEEDPYYDLLLRRTV